MRNPTRQAAFLLLLLVPACSSSTQGAHPHDMSTEGHQGAARTEDASAKEHAGQYDASRDPVRRQCDGGKSSVELFALCWTSVSNPTDKHRAEAEAHRKAAADHRAASKALVDAEARACGGIALADRDMSPFERTEDIASVVPLSPTVSSSGDIPRTEGATVTFRAVPGMTAEWMQRLVDCHLARSAALGHQLPEMPHCPLVPNGVTARVTSTGDGFVVAVRADTEEGAREVLRRARQLKAP